MSAKTSPSSHPGACGEPQTAAAPEALGLLGDDDLRAEAGQLADEPGSLAGRAGEDDARHAGARESPDLIGGKRPAGDVDQRLRPAARSVAEPFGLAAGEDQCLHGRLRLGRGGLRRPRDCDVGNVRLRPVRRPIPS